MRLTSILCAAAVFTSLFVAPTPSRAAEEIAASGLTNPAPSEPFSGFDHFEVAKVVLQPPYAGQKANEHALLDAQADMDKRLNEWVAAKNAQPAKSETPRVLLIEPRIEKIKFVGGGARVWGGALAGSSRILLKVKFTDKATGAVIAEPEFYQHAGGISGAWSFGAADKAMIERAANLVAEYLQGNYDQPVGGPTGMAK